MAHCRSSPECQTTTGANPGGRSDPPASPDRVRRYKPRLMRLAAAALVERPGSAVGPGCPPAARVHEAGTGTHASGQLATLG